MNFKKIALAKILKNADTSLFGKLKIEKFTDRNSRFIFKTISAYVNKFNKIPSIEVLSSAISSQVASDKAEIYEGYLEGLSLVNIDNVEEIEVLEGLEQDSIVSLVDRNIEELVEAGKTRDSDSIKRILTDLNNSVFSPSLCVEDAKDMELSVDNIKSIDCFIPTVDTYNTKLFGVTLISGSSGGGKSIWALNQAIYSYKQGMDILYMNLELGSNEQMARTLSHIYKEPFTNIYSPTLSEKEINEWNKKHKDFFSSPNKFKMVNTNVYKNDILTMIRNEASSGLDLVVLDYIQLVGNDSLDKDWAFISNLVKDLHRLSLELGIVILTPIQINTADVKEEQNEITLTTRGSRELEFSSSLWFHIHQTKEEYTENVVRMFTIKARHSDKKIFLLETEFDKMTFNDSGVVL